MAGDLAERFEDGVWLVELASLSDPALVPQTVAFALGIREQPGRLLTDTLSEYLELKKMLLVLDNCEHLVEACARLAEERGEDGAAKRASRALFGAQLLLNVLWTYVFFGRRAPGWAFVEVVFLLAAIAVTAVSFSKISRTAALLLVPYLLWTGFASVLNFCVWRLNR